MNIYKQLKEIEKINPDQAQQIRNWLNIYLSAAKNENFSKPYEQKIPNITRGQILAVNFGYGIQSEFRNFHYCVALHNSPKKTPKVTVVPITSKKHPHQIDIGYEMADNLETLIRNKERSTFWIPYRALERQCQNITGLSFGTPAIGCYSTVYPNCTAHIKRLKDEFAALPKDLVTIDAESILNKILSNLESFKKFLDDSPKLLKHSYLRVDDITTISKARIKFPKYTHHPLYKLKLTTKTLNKLDQEIIRRFTKQNI